MWCDGDSFEGVAIGSCSQSRRDQPRHPLLSASPLVSHLRQLDTCRFRRLLGLAGGLPHFECISNEVCELSSQRVNDLSSGGEWGMSRRRRFRKTNQ